MCACCVSSRSLVNNITPKKTDRYSGTNDYVFSFVAFPSTRHCPLPRHFHGDTQSEVYSLDWVSNMIASGSGDGRILLWDAVTGACKASLADVGGPQDGVTSVVLRQARVLAWLRGRRAGGDLLAMMRHGGRQLYTFLCFFFVFRATGVHHVGLQSTRVSGVPFVLIMNTIMKTTNETASSRQRYS